jgi:hypothetical protein
MAEITKGARIELLAMPQDPNPIPSGTQGTVIDSTAVHLGAEHFTQILVQWDTGRTLSCVTPPDRIRIL